MRRGLDQTMAWLISVVGSGMLFGVGLYVIVRLAQRSEANGDSHSSKVTHAAKTAPAHGGGHEEHATGHDKPAAGHEEHAASHDSKEEKADEPDHAPSHDKKDAHDGKHEGGHEKSEPDGEHHGSVTPMDGEPIVPAGPLEVAPPSEQKKTPRSPIRVQPGPTVGVR